MGLNNRHEAVEGKLPIDLLEKIILNQLPTDDPRILVGPKPGEDAAVIDMGERVLVAHSDPITGAVERIGWYAVHIACNDIAATGAKPMWVLPVILAPKGRLDLVSQIISDIASAAREIEVSVIGGHTEITGWLERPIVSMTALGEAPKDSYVTTGGARPGDTIIATKSIALEGTSILARDFKDKLAGKIPKSILEKAAQFINQISVVKDALTAVKAGEVHAMHDPTEGGLLGGIYEMAVASGLGAKIYEEKIPIRGETLAICKALGVDPLKLISSGTLLIAADPDSTRIIIEKLRQQGIDAAPIGVFTEKGPVRLVRKDGSIEHIDELPVDELWKLYQ